MNESSRRSDLVCRLFHTTFPLFDSAAASARGSLPWSLYNSELLRGILGGALRGQEEAGAGKDDEHDASERVETWIAHGETVENAGGALRAFFSGGQG